MLADWETRLVAAAETAYVGVATLIGDAAHDRRHDVNASMRQSREKTRLPILAAGGILLRGRGRPEIALVQLRKMSAWVLPKGKLAAGESAIAAARREVIEETGQRVSIHEFLGALAYETGGRQKIVRFWRMQALGGPLGELMRDVKAMEWLALDEAIERLTHTREQVFLEQIGPTAIRLAERRPRKSVVRHPRPAPAPRPEATKAPGLLTPAEFAAPLPPDSIALAPLAGPSVERRMIERPAGNHGLFERTLDWLREAALLPKPQRD
jgi:8-oxo-dGTP diphosphatase